MLSSYLLGGFAALTTSVSASAIAPRDSHNHIIARQNADCIQVSVTFNELKATQWGESVSVVGSVAQLGTWNTSQAAFMIANPATYSDSNPLWSTTVNFPPGTTFQYKYITFQADGSVVWEADPNHSYTVPNTCTSQPSVSDKWQSTAATTPTSTTTSATPKPTPTCTNSPTSRNCWQGQYSLDTDFDTNW
jgi:laccase